MSTLQKVLYTAAGTVVDALCPKIKLPEYKLDEKYGKFKDKVINSSMHVGPCHHGMTRPRVADGGEASNME